MRGHGIPLTVADLQSNFMQGAGRHQDGVGWGTVF